jgi:hypothetical protein
MKGIIMNLLAEMVETTYGMAEWNDLLNDAGLSGVYTSASLYPDSEIMTLVDLLSKRKQVPVNDLVFAFGQFMFPAFHKRYPQLIDQFDDFLTLLESIDSVIHVEVNKLHPDAVTPVFRHERLNDHTIRLEYQSKRQLCRLAEGLIDGASQHFKQPMHLLHDPCSRDGADHCGFLVSLG